MDPKDIPSGIAGAIDVLAAKFGATGAALWTELCNYKLAQGVTGIAVACLLMIVSGICAAAALHANNWDDDMRFGAGALFVGALVIAIILFACSIPLVVAPGGAILAHIIGK